MTYYRLHAQVAPPPEKIWRLEPLRPILPNSLEMLIEVLVPAFADPAPRRTVLITPDPYLESSLVEIGLVRVAEDRFEIAGPPVHPFTHDAAEYFRYCKVRERYMLGISNRVVPNPAEPILKGATPVQAGPRIEESFSALSAKRRSPAAFVPNQNVNRSIIETILQDSYYVRSDGHLPYASAGGFAVIGLLVADHSGLHEVDPQTRRWIERRPSFDNAYVRTIGFDQPWADHASFWLIPYLRIGESAQKYGARAYRFALLAAGAFLHQATLSGGSLGLASRLLGGFDDLAAGQLGLIDEAEQMVVGFLGFGRPS